MAGPSSGLLCDCGYESFGFIKVGHLLNRQATIIFLRKILPHGIVTAEDEIF
jgi:hypothetical protein